MAENRRDRCPARACRRRREGHEAVLSGRRAGVQAIVRTEHLPDLVTSAHQRVAYRAMVRQLDRVICVSYEAARSYLDAGLPPERVRVVQNGIEPLSAPPERLGLDDDARLVVSVGRLTEQKGFDLLLDVAAELRETHFYVVGEGPLASSLQAGIEGRGLGARLRLLGRREDVPSLLAGANVLAMPSRFEGLPIAALEAMSLGKPVVGTRVCGLTEAVVDGSTGRLVPEGDARCSPARSTRFYPRASWPRASGRRAGAGNASSSVPTGWWRRRSASTKRSWRNPATCDESRGDEASGRGSASSAPVDRQPTPRQSSRVSGRSSRRRRGPYGRAGRGDAARCGASVYPDHVAMLEGERLDALYIAAAASRMARPSSRPSRPAAFFRREAGGGRSGDSRGDRHGPWDQAESPDGGGLSLALSRHGTSARRALLEDNPARLVLGYWLDSTPPPAWWWSRTRSGGQMVEQTTHVLRPRALARRAKWRGLWSGLEADRARLPRSWTLTRPRPPRCASPPARSARSRPLASPVAAPDRPPPVLPMGWRSS